MRENPYQSPVTTDHAIRTDRPVRSKFAKVLFGLASIPALFLPIALLLLILWPFLSAAIYGSFVDPKSLRFAIVLTWTGLAKSFVYADVAQLPIYMVWALCSRELEWRQRVLWAIVLYVANAFTIPWFRYAKYTGTTSQFFCPKSTSDDELHSSDNLQE